MIGKYLPNACLAASVSLAFSVLMEGYVAAVAHVIEITLVCLFYTFDAADDCSVTTVGCR